jgi:hypothetical protein
MALPTGQRRGTSGAMAEKLKIAGLAYLALALIWLGIQLPIRLVDCSGALSCTGSLATAPFWALVWPVYWPLSDLVPRLATVAVVLLSVPLAAAILLVGAWQRWAEDEFGR